MLIFVFPFVTFAQTGINILTPDPKVALDVNGHVKVRVLDSLAVITRLDNLIITRDPTNGVLEKVDFEDLLFAIQNELNLNNANVNSTIVKANFADNISLLNLGLFSGWRSITVASSNIDIAIITIRKTAILFLKMGFMPLVTTLSLAQVYKPVYSLPHHASEF